MNRFNDIFESHLKEENLGKIYKGNNDLIHRVFHEFNDSIQLQMKNTPSLPKPNLYVTTKALDFSVFVFKEQDHYFIGIGVDTINALFRFFQFLYSQPYFDPESGDVTKEKETSLDINLNPDYLLDYFYNYDLDISPNCPIRESIATQVFYRAINYLLLHEYAHITHGHLDYLSRETQHYFYYEKDTINTRNADIEKALEYDADSAATTNSLIDNTMLLMFSSMSEDEYNLRINLRQLNIAVYFLNKLTGLTDIEFEDYAHKSHPISDQRTYSHCGLTATYFLELKDRYSFDVNDLIEYGLGVVFNISVPAYSKMFNKEPLDDKFLFFNSTQGLPYNNNIRTKWNIVRKELEKFTYVEIAPEDEMFDGVGLYDYEVIMEKMRGKNVDSCGEV